MSHKCSNFNCKHSLRDLFAVVHSLQSGPIDEVHGSAPASPQSNGKTHE